MKWIYNSGYNDYTICRNCHSWKLQSFCVTFNFLIFILSHISVRSYLWSLSEVLVRQGLIKSKKMSCAHVYRCALRKAGRWWVPNSDARPRHAHDALQRLGSGSATLHPDPCPVHRPERGTPSHPQQPLFRPSSQLKQDQIQVSFCTQWTHLEAINSNQC